MKKIGIHSSRLSTLAILAITILWTVPALAGGHSEAMLLSCMDYRLMDETEQYMEGHGLLNNYDHVVLAGASLGAITDKRPAWNETFWEHLDVAVQLHAIKKVVILDHRDCGAYRVFLEKDFAKDPAEETAIHTAKMNELAKQIHEKRPELEVEMLLMGLDGKVEEIGKVAATPAAAPATQAHH